MIHCYNLHGHNIVLDVASGAIHIVDDVVYDVIREYDAYRKELEQRDSLQCLASRDNKFGTLVKRTMQIHPNVKASDVRAILVDVEILINRGKLFSPDNFANNAGDRRNAPTKALCLNVSHACNMECAYCFAVTEKCDAVEKVGCADKYDSVNTVSDKGSPPFMSFETGKSAIDFLIENSGSRKNLDIDFFGGEPLLNWQVVKDIVTYAREAEKDCGKSFRFTLTTNGLLIDDDVIDFANKHMHNVVLSLDGRPEIHNAMRKLPSGGSSFSEVLPRIKRMVEARQCKGYYIRGTFTRKNMDFTNDILHLSDLGFTELSFEPIAPLQNKSCNNTAPTFGDSRHSVTSPAHADSLFFTKDDLPKLFEQYDILAEEMQRREPLGKGFTFYHYILNLEGGPCLHKRLAGCGVATEYLAVTPSGELYPCHRFIGNDRFLMGDVKNGLTNQRLREQFANNGILSRIECENCWAKYYCSGGCAATAHFASGSINGIDEVGCELFKKRIENAIYLQAAKSVE